MDELEQLFIQQDILTEAYVNSGGWPIYRNREMEERIERLLRQS